MKWKGSIRDVLEKIGKLENEVGRECDRVLES
jgi:hypothetical protein